MILRFRHRGLERLYSRGDTSGVSMHPLRGDRAGQWSVSISGNWCVIFEFEGQHVTNVDLVDYH